MKNKENNKIKSNGYWKVQEFVDYNLKLDEQIKEAKDHEQRVADLKLDKLFLRDLYKKQQNQKRWDKFLYVFVFIGLFLFALVIVALLNLVKIPHMDELVISTFSYFLAEKVAIGTYLGLEIRRGK